MKFNTKLILFATIVIAASILYADSAKISVVKNNNVLRAESGAEGAKVLKKKKKGPAAPAAPAAPADLYTVSMLGDIGQFEYYRNMQGSLPEFGNPAGGSSNDISAKTCQDLLNSHKKMNDLMVNFEKLLNQIKANDALKTDEAAILGDSIYVEKKGAGDDLASIRKAASNLVSPHQLVNDLDIIKGSEYNNDAQITNIKTNDDKQPNQIAELRDREKRLICGWYYLKNILFTPQNSPAWLIDNINFINGNHTYDIDYKFETEFVNKFLLPKSFMVKQAGGQYTDRKATPLKPQEFLLPRAVKANTNKLNIQYIDLDPSLLVCSDTLVDYGKNDVGACNDAFKTCYANRMANKNMSVLDNAETSCPVHLNYLKLTLQLLKDVSSEDVDWRIARMHQPIFNVEYDYAGMKYNRLLMDRFKQAHIHVWFVSHFHNAQFTVSLYEQGNYKYKPQSPFKGGLYSTIRGNIAVASQSQEAFKGLNDFLFSKTGPSEPSYKFTNKYKMGPDGKPTTDIAAIIPNYNYVSWVDRSSNVFNGPNTVQVAKCNEEFIFQFLTGNSGRVLDPLFNDKFSDLMLIFGQAYTGQHGYTRFRFYKNGTGDNCLEGTYLILDAAGVLKPVYKQEVCQTFTKEGCAAKDRLNVLLDKNFKKNPAGVNVVMDHLNNTSDPYGADVATYK